MASKLHFSLFLPQQDLNVFLQMWSQHTSILKYSRQCQIYAAYKFIHHPFVMLSITFPFNKSASWHLGPGACSVSVTTIISVCHQCSQFNFHCITIGKIHYLVWAIASHGMYESHLFVFLLFLLFQWTWHEGKIFTMASHC
jgi:hypothetical protein